MQRRLFVCALEKKPRAVRRIGMLVKCDERTTWCITALLASRFIVYHGKDLPSVGILRCVKRVKESMELIELSAIARCCSDASLAARKRINFYTHTFLRTCTATDQT